jgi:hypothetical protein
MESQGSLVEGGRSVSISLMGGEGRWLEEREDSLVLLLAGSQLPENPAGSLQQLSREAGSSMEPGEEHIPPILMLSA